MKRTIRQIAVGLGLGITVAPLVAFAVGAVASPLALWVCRFAGIDAQVQTGNRGAALLGAVVAPVWALVYAPPIGVLLRLVSKTRGRKITAMMGGLFGAYLAVILMVGILRAWIPSWEAIIMLTATAGVVGWVTGYCAVAANPPWARDAEPPAAQPAVAPVGAHPE